MACLSASFSQNPKSAETICPTSKTPSTKAAIPATMPAIGMPAPATAPATPAPPSVVAAAAAAEVLALATCAPAAWADNSVAMPAWAVPAEADLAAPAAPLALALICAACSAAAESSANAAPCALSPEAARVAVPSPGDGSVAFASAFLRASLHLTARPRWRS